MWVYKGGDHGKHIPGVPNRDLTDAEYDALEDWQKAIAETDSVFVRKPDKGDK